MLEVHHGKELDVTRFIALLFTLMGACAAVAAEQPDRVRESSEGHYNASLVESLLAEGTPRALVLAATSLPYAGNPAGLSRQALLDRAAQAAPDDPFVQWFAALYTAPATTLSEPAKAVLRLEPDNGAAWMFVLQAASEAKDENGVTEALAHLGAAAAFDEHYADFTLAWMEAFRAHPRPAQPELDREQALAEEPLIMAMARSTALALPAFSSLISACSDKSVDLLAGRRDACIAAARLMAGQSTAIISRGMGNALLRRSGAPQAATAMRDFEYINSRYALLSSTLECDPVEFDAFEADWMETRNEIQVAERALLRDGHLLQPPPDWQPDDGSLPPVDRTGCH
ncbi:hypothetical protein [Dokdonella sp.]|uniref:hypothetical protein n=1 Tax=Dokdonella sp. TaxID=2291710 RepID=UPI00352704B9